MSFYFVLFYFCHISLCLIFPLFGYCAAKESLFEKSKKEPDKHLAPMLKVLDPLTIGLLLLTGIVSLPYIKFGTF